MPKVKASVLSMSAEQLENERQLCTNTTRELMEARAEQLGYKNLNSYQTALGKMGIIISYVPTYPDVPPPVTANPELTDVEVAILDIINKGAASVGEISRRIDRSSETVIKTIDSLRHKHHHVVLDETRHEVSIPHEPVKEFRATEFDYYRNFYTIGIVSDTHLNSIYQQMTVLHDIYKLFDDRETDFNLHAGDLVDGVDMYKGHRQEIFKHNASQQKDYVVKHYPKSRRNTKTYIIGGQHDFSFYKQNGYDIVEHVCEKRKDLKYRGMFAAQFKVKGIPIELQHPGGGLAYAISYNPQKMAESVSGYILSIMRNDPKGYMKIPALMLVGHYHVPMHLPNYMGMDVATLPCTQMQTRYLQQHKKIPYVGCCIAEVWLDETDNLSSVTLEFVNMNHRIKEEDY